jgi:hypothetical protein
LPFSSEEIAPMNQTCLFYRRDRARRGWQALPLALGVLMLTLGTPAIAQERMLNTLTVTGQGTETIPTTTTRVQLGVEVQGETASQVQQEVARRSSAVVEFLRSQNVEKLQTTGVRLNPRYNYDGDTPQITGYSGSNTVSFEVPTERAGALIDEAIEVGATRIDSVSFTAADAAIETAQQQALREATQDAQRQAETVLSALNLTRKAIVSVQINGATPPPPIPVPRLESRAASLDRAETPIVGGEQEVQASVTLEISY